MRIRATMPHQPMNDVSSLLGNFYYWIISTPQSSSTSTSIFWHCHRCINNVDVITPCVGLWSHNVASNQFTTHPSTRTSKEACSNINTRTWSIKLACSVISSSRPDQTRMCSFMEIAPSTKIVCTLPEGSKMTLFVHFRGGWDWEIIGNTERLYRVLCPGLVAALVPFLQDHRWSQCMDGGGGRVHCRRGFLFNTSN